MTLVRDRRGGAAVEFALTLPFLILILFAVVDLGRAVWQHHVVAKSIRDATRYLARTPDPSSSVFQGMAINLGQRGSIDASKAPLLGAGGDDMIAVSFQITWVDNAAGTWRGAAMIPVVNGQASYAFKPMFGFDLVEQLTISAGHVQRHLGE
ncbi:MAG: pilus assembly protein [Alphaproteobacteria bacterium]|nr:pilus assembly protein [Alphaproteobacteria bacterium]